MSTRTAARVACRPPRSWALPALAALLLSCRGSSPGGTTTQGARVADPAALARIGTEAVHRADLSKGVQAQLVELELDRYGLLANEVTSIVERRLVELAAKDAGVEPGAFLKREVEQRAPQPTAEDVAQLLAQPAYAEPLARMLAAADQGQAGESAKLETQPASARTSAGTPEDRARLRAKREAAIRDQLADRARQALQQQRQAAARAALLDEWREKYAVAVDVAVPDVPRVTVAPEGFVSAESTPAGSKLFLYLDPTDPSSRRILREVDAQVGASRAKPAVAVTYLPSGARAEAAVYAEALQCAAAGGHGHAFHEALFKPAQVPGTDQLVEIATAVGADSVEFTKCLSEHAQRAAVQKIVASARGNGATSAPTMFFNGIRLTARQTALIRPLARDDRATPPSQS